MGSDYLMPLGFLDTSAAFPRAVNVARWPSTYPPVGGSTASMGMSLPVLPLRDVVARVGLEHAPSLRFAVWVAPLSWLSGAAVFVCCFLF
jgi:hypothetical protein